MPETRRLIRTQVTTLWRNGAVTSWQQSAQLLEEHDPHKAIPEGMEGADVGIEDFEDSEYDEDADGARRSDSDEFGYVLDSSGLLTPEDTEDEGATPCAQSFAPREDAAVRADRRRRFAQRLEKRDDDSRTPGWQSLHRAGSQSVGLTALSEDCIGLEARASG